MSAAFSSSTRCCACRRVLPFNPAEQSAVAPDLSFNTAVSFITNTNWQNYGGESTMSYLVQMLGLTHQNFLSAATGIVLAVALIRGFARASAQTIGNFWVDITRCTLYILLPICIVYALFLVWQGMPQTLGAYVDATTLEGAKQTIAVGPVASQIAIKMLGTNGGGFFNANAAHPFENPTALSNFVQMVSIFAHRRRRSPTCSAAWSATSARAGPSSPSWACCSSPASPSPTGRKRTATTPSPRMGLTGGNMEGKEVRFGIVASALFAVITTAASCGAVNAMHDSLHRARRHDPADQHPARRDHRRRRRRRPLRHAAVRHPRDLRRRPDGRPHAGICRQEDRGQGSQDGDARHPDPAADVSRLDRGRGGRSRRRSPRSANPGPHGFSEMLYAYTSQTGNNGSAFGGLTGNTPVLQHHRRHRDVGRPLLDDHPGHGDRRLARGQEDRCRRRPARSRPPAACSSACSSA